MKIVFFGNEQLAQGLTKPRTPVFDALVDEGFEIMAVVLPQNPSSSARSRRQKELRILVRAHEEGVPVIFTDETSDSNGKLREMGAEFGVLSSYGKIVKQATIDVFPKGILNIHPSLLPKYRGTTPIETAILNGDEEIGVSVMKLVAKMDAGEILAQERIKVDRSESKDEIYARLADLGAEMMIKVLRNCDKITPREQDEARATFTKKLDKTISELHTAEKTADELVREIRAYAGFPKSKISIDGVRTTVVEAHAADEAPAGLLGKASFKTKDGRFLVVDEIIPENSRKMSAEAFLRGRK